MTFTEESINGIAIDMSDEWQWMSENEISVKFYGLEDYAERFWQRHEKYPDGWIDCYAFIVLNEYNERYVREIEFLLRTNDGTEDRYLMIKLNYNQESRMIASMLCETSNGGLVDMLKEGLR